MLNPNSRAIYLDELRPPEQYCLDWAVGTTFSLDLLSLLIVPMSMSLYDYSGDEETPNNPVALLDAIRKMSDRFVVFCQAGRISVPKQDTRLFNYLERSVFGVNLPTDTGLFHPKTWLLRFTNQDSAKGVLYRFLCLSRNLTFDRSWDTILTLEGILNTGRTRAYSRNHPLADFIKALPDLSQRKLSTEQLWRISQMSDEVRRVEFKPPPGFDNEISFIPSGIPGYQVKRKLDPQSRMMIVSPFLSEELLTPLQNTRYRNYIVSRFDSLESLSGEAINRLQLNSDLYYLDNAAESEDFGNDAENGFVPGSNDDFRGLHAKLYLSELGWDARIDTGSANATNAAHLGNNVEFLVTLKGRKSKVGIDAFLGNENSNGTFRDLLCQYHRGDDRPTEDAIHVRLDNMLEQARKQIAKTELLVEVASEQEGLFSLIVKSSGAMADLAEGVFATCYPISVHESYAQDIRSLNTSGVITFDGLSVAATTSFIAFHLSAVIEGHAMSTAFVRNLPIVGLPKGRDNSVLIGIISDSRRFIQYLLLILMGEPSQALDVFRDDFSGNRSGEKSTTWGMEDIPLFEELLRASSRHPEKLQQVNQLIQDIKEANPDNTVLPEGFESIWSALIAAQKHAEMSSK